MRDHAAESATVGSLFDAARNCLRSHNIPNAELDARVLVSAILNIETADVIGRRDHQVEEEAARSVATAIQRRVQREPVSRIVGMREFWGLEFELSEATLDPRPDSETLVEFCLETPAAGDRGIEAGLHIADLGTGTGCLLTALLSEWPGALGVGIDLSADALCVARRNARRNGVSSRAQFVCGNWLSAVETQFDLIVANPPYIRSHDLLQLQPEVAKHEPHLALDGGEDGLDPYRILALQVPQLLKPNGWFVVEFGCGQEADVASLLVDAGFTLGDQADAMKADLSGIPRCVRARYSQL